MLATKRQIDYVQRLSDRACWLKLRHPGVIPSGVYPQRFELGMKKELAEARIAYFSAILNDADKILYRSKKEPVVEDLPL